MFIFENSPPAGGYATLVYAVLKLLPNNVVLLFNTGYYYRFAFANSPVLILLLVY